MRRRIIDAPLEFMASLELVVFGLTLLAPGNSFDVSHAYAFLGHFMSEDVWGIVFTAIGIFTMWCLLHGNTMERRFSMMVAFSVYLLIFSAFMISVFSTTTVYGVFAIAAGWAYHNLGQGGYGK